MTVIEFLQWLGVGGVAILALIFSQFDKAKTKEEVFTERLQKELDKRDVQYNELIEKINQVEVLNDELRSKNIELVKEKALLEVENIRLKKDMESRIEYLEQRNEILEKEIKQLKDK